MVERNYRETAAYYYNMFHTPELMAKARKALQELEPGRVGRETGLNPLGALYISHHKEYIELIRGRMDEIRAEHGLEPLAIHPKPPMRWGMAPSPVFDVETGMDYASKALVGDTVGPSYSFKPSRWAWSRLDMMFPNRFKVIPYDLYFES